MTQKHMDALKNGLVQIPKRNLRALLGRMERGLQVLLSGDISKVWKVNLSAG